MFRTLRYFGHISRPRGLERRAVESLVSARLCKAPPTWLWVQDTQAPWEFMSQWNDAGSRVLASDCGTYARIQVCVWPVLRRQTKRDDGGKRGKGYGFAFRKEIIKKVQGLLGRRSSVSSVVKLHWYNRARSTQFRSIRHTSWPLRPSPSVHSHGKNQTFVSALLCII